MKTSRILLGFGRLSDGDIETKALAVKVAMTGNPYFPNPTPGLDVLDTAIKNYSDAHVAAQTRDKVKVVIKNDMRKSLEAVLHSLGSYVSFIANGNRIILASSGFSLNSEFSNPQTLGPVENFAVQVGKVSGQAILSVAGVKNARSYMALYVPAQAVTTNDAWMHVSSGSSSIVIDKLTPGTSYNFRIGIAGTKGQMVYTEIITKLVL